MSLASSLSFRASSWLEEEALHIPAALAQRREEILAFFILQSPESTTPLSLSFINNQTPPHPSTPTPTPSPLTPVSPPRDIPGNSSVDPVVEEHKQSLYGLFPLRVDLAQVTGQIGPVKG